MYALEPLVERARAASDHYHEFLRVPDLSLGVYVLGVGATDPQTPHSEDESYFVVRGAAQFRCGSSDSSVGTGDVLFVSAGVEHRFHDVRQELVLLVTFGPAEGTRKH